MESVTLDVSMHLTVQGPNVHNLMYPIYSQIIFLSQKAPHKRTLY